MALGECRTQWRTGVGHMCSCRVSTGTKRHPPVGEDCLGWEVTRCRWSGP